MNISKKKADFINIIIILAVIIFMLYNVFTNKFVGGSNDMEPHAYHMWFLKENLVNFHKIPSWTSDFFGGKPFLGAYQPLTYFLALPISLVTNGLSTTKIFIFMISLLSAFFFYLFANKIFKGKLMVLISTLIFVLFPNRLMLTGGGTLAQFTGIMFVPLAFYFYEVYKEKQRLYALSMIGLFTGLCLLTHHGVGGPLLFAILLMGGYDYFIEKNKFVLKVIPFLVISVIIALVFLIPAYQVQETLNFAVIKNAGEGFRPFSYYRLFSRFGSRGEFMGVFGFILFLFSLPKLIPKFGGKKKFNKYILVSLVLLILGLHLSFLIPGFIKDTLQGAHRLLSVLSVSLGISMTVGLMSLSKLIFKIVKKYNILNLKKKSLNYKKIVSVCIILLLASCIIGSYSRFRPASGNELQIPEGVVDFYKEIAKDKTYYRIEDQTFAPFGTTPIMHKHGILNGAPMQEAPKYHFYFWSTSWNLLNSIQGIQNFAGLYGTLSIKYLLFKNEFNVPYLKEIKKGPDYYIYENERALDYVRLVPNIVVVNINEPDYMPLFMGFLSKNIIDFNKVAFVNSNTLNNDFNQKDVIGEKAEIIEREPGYLKLKLVGIKEKTYLSIADSYHPYWKASQEGNKLIVYKGIPSTLIIPIEKDGIVEVKYSPPKIRTILFYITLITIVFLIGLCIYDVKRNGRKNK